MKNKLLVLALLLITISTQAQVGNWLLNNNANDATSNAINGTLTGSPTFSTSSIEGAYALVLNGTSQYVDLGNPSTFPSAKAARTISAWAMATSVTGSRSIFAYGTSATTQGMTIGMSGTSLIGGGYANNMTVTNFWATGVWHHICLTYDGTTANLYADGSLVSTSSRNWSLVLSKAYIGKGLNGTDYWSGSIDDVRIYNTALTASQVQAIATAPPTVPTGLAATSTTPTSVSLSWTDASTNETGFSVERSTTTGTGFSVLTTTAANATSYTDATTTEGTNYFYRIQSTNAGGSSVYTSEATVTTLPNAPTGLTATTASATSITLNWTDASSKETGYDIERSLTSGSGFSVVGTAAANAVTYTDASLTTGTTYYYRIKSKVGTVGSVYSSVVSAVSSIIAPTVSSSNLQFSNINLTSLTLTWTPGNGQRRIVILKEYGSAISRSPANGQSNTANSDKSLAQNLGEHNFLVYDGTGSSVTITGLINSTAYAVGIFEYNGSGETSMYLTNSPLTGSTTTAGAIRPTVQASNLIFSNVSQTSMTLSWTPGNGEKRVIIASNGSSGVITKWPSNGQVVSANSSWSLAQNLDGNNHAVYDGTGSSVTITGLDPATSYAFGIFEYNGGDGSSVYMGTDETSSYLTNALTGSQTTSTSYDFRSGAELLTNLNNWSSADAAYTNVGATGTGFNEESGVGVHNVWFKFQATTNEIDVRALFGGTKGSIASAMVRLYNDTGTEIASAAGYSSLSFIQFLTLNPGSNYYISVDSDPVGTFTLQVNDHVGNDNRQKAVLITDTQSWSSVDAEFNNINATASAGNSYHDVWFKFVAVTNEIDIRVLTGGSKGTLGYLRLSLFNEAGEVIGGFANSSWSTVNTNERSYTQNLSLTPGTTYYFSIDDDGNYTGGGTFSLKVKNTIDYDNQAKALQLLNTTAWVSADAEYSNIGATGAGFNTPWGVNPNVWFKFTAETSKINVGIITGGTKGNLVDGTSTIFDESGTVISTNGIATALTPGMTYYILVSSTSQGTFTLTVDDGANYDFRSHALLLSDLNSWSSSDAAYTNVGATGTGFNEESGVGIHNVWFKFQATTNEIDIRVLHGGSKGTITLTKIYLFDDVGNKLTTVTDNYSTYLQTLSLTPGAYYYFTVDDENSGSGTFTVQINDQIGYDMASKAVLLTDLNSWSSADAAYSNVGATGSYFNGDPWGGQNNVWFKFQATTNEIDIRVLYGGSKGTLLPVSYLFDANGNKLVVEANSSSAQNYVSLQSINLTPGSYYYFSVDDPGTGTGTFSIQINDQVGYDMASKALLLTDLNSWSSADAAYSNEGATGCYFNGDPWGGQNNVWFKFQATTNEIDIRVLYGGSKGTLLPVSYLFDANGNKLVVEANSSSAQNYVSLQSINLTPGSYYYFSVDDPNNATGTFSIQINDKVDFDMAAKAYLLPSIDAWTSADAAFNNENATGCYFNGDPWGGQNNVWFKFQATTNEIDINLLTGGTKGTLTSPIINLFDVNGTQLSVVPIGTSSIKNITLTPGSYYYFSVDNANFGGGTFSLFIDNGENYDFRSHALLLTDLNNWSSADAAYSNVGATPDAVVGTQANCIPPNHNVWFKFQATTNEIEIKALTGGTNGEIGYISLSLFDASGNSVACHYSNGGVVSFLQVTTLTPGSWYYFSVDNAAGGQGTFSLKITDTIGYDLKAKAELLTNIHNWSSSGNTYSNVDATPDAVVGSQANCIPPNHNVWFKFQATTTEIEIKALTGGTNGNIGYISLSIFDASGNSVACDYSNGGLLSVLLATTLTPGSWYYFSVDNAAGGQGAFALKVNDAISYDRRIGAVLLTNLNNWSSADAVYTNVETTGTGFNEEPGVANNNVWFKFQATTNEIDIRLLSGGSKGTLGYPNLHLFDGNGNLLDNARYTDIQRIDLTPGSFYYFSVDSEVGNSAGTFSIRINDHVDYNMRAKAELLTNLNNWSSADAAYTNVGATSRTFNEEVGGAANNVWFKFQATTTEIDIRLLTGGTKGTFTNYPRLYLYDEAGNPLDAQQYTDIQRIDLIPGSNYYIMVFSATDGAGTFSLQVNDHVNYNMRAKAELLTNLNNWSSVDASYTNVGATARAFNEEVGGVNNVWFKFQATTNEIDIRLLTGGSKGTFTEYPRIVLYDEMGTRLNFEQYTDIQRIDLTPGSDYYIMVYSETNGTGTFSLQVNDHVNYNMRAKAELLTNISDWQSEDAGYSNDGATNKGFNEESGGGYQNVWFKFLATTNKIDIKVLTGEGKGTLSNPIITLFDNDGNVIASDAKGGHTVADLTTSSLVIGSNYYFSIDNDGGATYIGTFSLELGGGLAPNALCDNIYCTDNGGIGIGTAVVPTGYTLAVNGKVIMEGAKVEVQSKWPDYVFEKDYPITEIPALKKYIEEHGHLPNVPSAKTVEKEGIDVEEINIALLQKIEELSLYLIKMEERLKKLEQENNTLRKSNVSK